MITTTPPPITPSALLYRGQVAPAAPMPQLCAAMYDHLRGSLDELGSCIDAFAEDLPAQGQFRLLSELASRNAANAVAGIVSRRIA